MTSLEITYTPTATPINDAHAALQNTVREALQNLLDMDKKMDLFEIDPYDFEDQFAAMIEECGGVEVGSKHYCCIHTLKEGDHTAFRCYLNDWADSAIDKEDCEEYQEMMEQREELETALIEADEQLEEFETENEVE